MSMSRRPLRSLLLALGCSAGIQAAVHGSAVPGAESEALVTVHPQRDLGPLGRAPFGHNIEGGDPRGIFAPLHPSEWNRDGMRTGEGYWDPEAKVPAPTMLDRLKPLGPGSLRYPGGCLAHGWDWHQSVGPVAQRGDWTFGLDEYLVTCRALGAEPIITLSDYTGTVQDQADLVEYLNGPADGKHRWADARAANGHPEPWGVRYLEIGNESDHGNHQLEPARKLTAEGYVAWAKQVSTAIAAVDPAVQFGVVMVPGTGQEPAIPWNRTVLAGTKDFADFVIIHFYAPNIPEGSDPAAAGRACLGVVDQLVHRLAGYRAVIREEAGKNLPLWLTEFNTMAVQEQPIPFRFGWPAALQAADFQRQLADPALGVIGANYWQALNGYWGMIETRGPAVVERSAYAAQRFLADHWAVPGKSTRRIAVDVRSERIPVAGFSGVWPATGDALVGTTDLGPLRGAPITARHLQDQGLAATVDKGVLRVPLRVSVETHTAHIAAYDRPAGATGGCAYAVSFRARFLAESGSARCQLGINVADARGWEQTKSAAAITGVEDAPGWRRFNGNYAGLADTPGIVIGLRLTDPTGPVAGVLELTDLEVRATTLPVEPAPPAVVASASRSGTTVRVVLINRDADRARPVAVDLGSGGPAKSWILAPADPFGTASPELREAGVVRQSDRTDRRFHLVLPPAAMAALEIERPGDLKP